MLVVGISAGLAQAGLTPKPCLAQRLALNGTVQSQDLVNVTIQLPQAWAVALFNATITGSGYVNVRTCASPLSALMWCFSCSVPPCFGRPRGDDLSMRALPLLHADAHIDCSRCSMHQLRSRCSLVSTRSTN